MYVAKLPKCSNLHKLANIVLRMCYGVVCVVCRASPGTGEGMDRSGHRERQTPTGRAPASGLTLSVTTHLLPVLFSWHMGEL